ncbi:MAG TPA: molybdopterin-dependent oxidoreductase, partial [Chloroflexota bacterium]|nr:molybdopterin-dependent oxidoreductase [Chloroflexota bacterium]
VIMINHNRCILCYRCVRVCDEQMGIHALDVVQRGSASFIASAQHKFMDCERCGMCIEVCPVGAVLSRPFKHNARAWQTEQTETTCPHCSVGCGVQLESRKGQVLRARVRPVREPNRGIACGKGFFGWEHVNAEERITEPMIRRNGELEAVSWPEALEFAARGLKQVVDAGGSESVAAIGSGEATVEDNYALQRLFRGVLGSNNVYMGRNGYEKAARTVMHALGADAVAHEQDEILNAGAVLVVGADINGTHNVLAAHLKQAARAGQTRLLVATRVGSGLDPFAEVKTRVRPGGEAALLAALAGEVEHLPASGVDVATVMAMRSIMEEVANVVIVWDTGIWTYGRETEVAAAAVNLALRLEGAITAPLPDRANLVGALAVGMAPDLLPGPARIEDDAARRKAGRAWKAEVGRAPGVGLEELIDGGGLQAAYVLSDDPAGNAADPAAMRAALEAATIVIVQATFPNATTELADVVLPGTTVAEKDGHFQNFEGRVVEINAAAPAKGQARPDWEIPARLAAELGHDYGFRSAEAVWAEFNEIAQPLQMEGSGERQELVAPRSEA